MRGQIDIMNAIREGLDAIHFASRDSSGKYTSWKAWTKSVYTTLCEIGQNQFHCRVCANRKRAPRADGPEWLYDMTWLEYPSHTVGWVQASGWFTGARLVAECEWSAFHQSIREVEDDFSKLLLARAGVRLMICYEWREHWHHDEIRDSESLAAHLARLVQRFNGTHAEDTYLLAVLGYETDSRVFRFKYFTLGLNGAVRF